MTVHADVGSHRPSLGLMMEFPRTGGRYAYASPFDIVAVEEGGLVGGEPTSRIVIIRGEAIYPLDVLGKARDVAGRLHEGRKQAADSFAYALLANEEKSRLEDRLSEAVVVRVQAALEGQVKDGLERLVPEAVGNEIAKMASEAVSCEAEPLPPGPELDAGGALDDEMDKDRPKRGAKAKKR